MSDTPPTLRSSDVVVLRNEVLGLPGFPRPYLLPTDWGKVAGGGGHGTTHVMSMHRLLHEALATMGRDILQLAWVSLRKFLYPTFPDSSFFC
jgi:hypothetical protein